MILGPSISGCLKQPFNCCSGPGWPDRDSEPRGKVLIYWNNGGGRGCTGTGGGDYCLGWGHSKEELSLEIATNPKWHLALCDNCVRKLGLVW